MTTHEQKLDLLLNTIFGTTDIQAIKRKKTEIGESLHGTLDDGFGVILNIPNGIERDLKTFVNLPVAPQE
jgi:hypothetical protein